MIIIETSAKSILRRHKQMDPWFISRCGMNLYRGCAHNCVYCNGRTEKYQTRDRFGIEVEVKTNAPEMLARELDPSRRRKPFHPGFLMIGGGVGDSFQPAEQHYRLTRQALKLALEYGYAVHVLTKSADVVQDIDLIDAIHHKARAIVSFSFSAVDETTCAIFEPGLPPPAKRLEAMAAFKRRHIPCGMFLMPVIPFISDTPEQISATLGAASASGADFMIFSPLTLKPGRQKSYFMAVLEKHFPYLMPAYALTYPEDNPWGRPIEDYHRRLNGLFHDLLRHAKIPCRIPPPLFRDILGINDLTVVLLSHLDYFLKLRNAPSTFGFAARAVARLDISLAKIPKDLRQINGIGKRTQKIIQEIIETGHTKLYDQLAG